MFQGNWKCSKCSSNITELPFEPRSEEGLVCRACYSNKKGGPTAPASAGDQNSQSDTEKSNESTSTEQSNERKMFSGDWKCGVCGVPIIELPFEPRETGNLKCLDCFKKSKGN